MAVRTTPPAAMLSKKFLRDGEKSFPAALATSGITIEAVNAIADRPFTVLSFNDASIPTSLDFEVELFTIVVFFACGKGNDGFKKGLERFLWVAWVSGKDIETEAEAINNYYLFDLVCFCLKINVGDEGLDIWG